ncbi:FAD-dependent oxidoreductase [Halomonas sp. McH1-25]|uniref:FAD-dependent oxidoreductase n=1 Tax=unclassified Halomonas TaxID=2609666 RepID=UPI001EF57EC7|nr:MULTISPECIES: FAD-dependent oxidoreductase [unclassified Halomonas]MCG7602224.1 FAD-dependent oxidoreductase [Halomonas sp. McH1-25]MCP1362465.1 FAD-dependent oxidoreductase [Halomonas sp. BBD45]
MSETSLDYDLVVVGSGAAGLSAAVTAAYHGLKVCIVEKDEVMGGATAWSGGWMWVPRNTLAQRAGIHEDIDTVRTYLRHELGDRYDAARIDAFLEAAPQMVSFFETHTALQFADCGAPSTNTMCMPVRAKTRALGEARRPTIASRATQRSGPTPVSPRSMRAPTTP